MLLFRLSSSGKRAVLQAPRLCIQAFDSAWTKHRVSFHVMDTAAPGDNLGVFHKNIGIARCEYPSALSTVGLARSFAMLAIDVVLQKVLWISRGDFPFF